MPVERLPALLLDDAVPREDGVVANDKPFWGFDGQPATAECGYAVNGRLHAVQGSNGETLYGKLEAKVVARTDGKWIASWWLDKADPLGKARTDISPAGPTSINADAVRIDDAELLGTSGRKPETLKSNHWSAGVTGGLVATIFGTPVPLRPDRVEHKESEVIFLERGRRRAGSGQVLAIRWKFAESKAQEQRMDEGLTLKANAALLLDEVADGAWEAGSPLWIRTASGFVRWHSAQGRLSYRTTAESRTVDVTGWLPAFAPDGFARLLLDASGDKTLTINTATRTAELLIEDPALMIALPRACCNGLQLAVPLLPPDDAAVTSTLCIVSQSLAPSEDLCTAAIGLEQTSPLTARLALTATRLAGATQYFAPAGNWVRLAESAANCAAGLARARVMLPHAVKTEAFALILGQDLEARGAENFDAEAALSVALPAVDGAARFVSGPLARFDIKDAGATADNYGLEIWPLPLGNQASTEPVVLRSLYRRSSAQGSFAADELPPYAATRVVATGIATPTIARSLIENAGTRWHYLRVAPGVDEAQLRFAPQQLGKRRGWVEGANFIGRTADKPGPIDYLELHGATKHVRNWLRLSNDTLVPRKAAPPTVGAPDPAAPGYYEGLAIDPLATRLGERDAPEERGSLSLFILEETLPESGGGSPRFALLLDLSSIGLDPVKIDIDPPKTPVVNRLVIAVANPKFGEAAAKPKQLGEGDPCRLALTSLNRLYLELEREGSHFSVRRGMLGWNASGAFGLVADDQEPLEVTEMFERRDGALSRTVEFNGVLPIIKEPMQEVVGLHNQAYRLTAYFWAATWRFTNDAAASTLRVICYHGWTYGGGTKWFASTQDGRVASGRLDLSADLVLMLAEDTRAADSRGTDSPWQAVRRHLYSVVLETPLGAGGQPSNKIAGFLTLRHRPAARFKVDEDPSPRDLQLIPDWRAAERDILPLFSDLPRPARPERLTWLRPRGKQEQRLNAGLEAAPGEALDVVLHAFVAEVPPIASFKLFACCLVGEIGREEGIPRWVPAPLRGGDAPPSRPPALPAGPPPRAMSRLWLFDGPPRMVNEWPDDPAYTPAEEASRTLARLGWTREAVLERDAGLGSEAVTWSVADSPLLNREASIGWFAWPLRAPGDKSTPGEWPQDALPCTQPAPQYEATAPRAFSIEVAFDEDRPVGAKADMPAATMPVLLDLAPAEGAGKVSVPIKLRSAGLRAGAWHRLVDYQQKSIKSQMFSPAALPAWGDEGRLATDPKRPGFFSWDERPVGSFRIVLPDAGAAPKNSYLLEVPTEAFGVRIIQSADELLIWTTQDKQGKEVDRTRIYEAWDVAGAKRLGIRMPQGAPFRTLLVEFYAKSPAGQAVAVEQRKYFDGGAERLAGIFDDSGQLQAFGSEQVSFYPDEAAPPTVGWKRVAEWQGRVGLQGDMAAWYVATVDIEGRFTLYRHGPLG